MDINRIKHLAELSYIDLTDNEKDEFLAQLKELFNHIEHVINNAEYRNIDNDDAHNRYLTLMHDDAEDDIFLREDIIFNAKREKNGYILVPKIIKGEE